LNLPSFLRQFPFIDKLFPHQGTEISRPSEVTDSVQLVHEIFRGDFKHAGIELRTLLAGQTAPGAADVVLALPEPPAGKVYLPFLTTAQHNQGVAVHVILRLQTSANVNTDVVNSWANAVEFYSAFLNQNIYYTLPSIPMFRGSFFNIVFTAPAAATVCVIRTMGIEVPLELVDISRMLSGQLKSSAQP